VRCRWVNDRGSQCGQPAGHTSQHGNGLLTTGRDEWHNPDAVPAKMVTKATEKDYTLREGDIQCLYVGIVGRCMLRLGHLPDVPHKESDVTV
jgi:hypothetical protein